MKRSKKGTFLCGSCNRPWSGHIVLQDNKHIRLYCLYCDAFILLHDSQEPFLTNSNGKVVDLFDYNVAISLADTEKPLKSLPQDHPANSAYTRFCLWRHVYYEELNKPKENTVFNRKKGNK